MSALSIAPKLFSDAMRNAVAGVTALANAIRDNGALIKLDISRNRIGAAQEGELQCICLASGIDLAK
jgi:hypothetical protein